MDVLTIAQILDIIRVNDDAMVTQFATWLTITFATIVAVFAGSVFFVLFLAGALTTVYFIHMKPDREPT